MSDIDKTPGSDDSDGGAGEPKVPEPVVFKAITSQDDFDAAIVKRLERERNKYKGYDDFKAKAEKFDAHEAEQGSEIEKLTRRAEKAEQERDAAHGDLTKAQRNDLVRDIADELGLPKSLVKRVQGDSDEDIRADIADLMSGLPSPSKVDDKKSEDKKEPPSQAPKPKMTFSETGDDSEGVTMSAEDVLKAVPRGGGSY